MAILSTNTYRSYQGIRNLYECYPTVHITVWGGVSYPIPVPKAPLFSDSPGALRLPLATGPTSGHCEPSGNSSSIGQGIGG
jgi:hypothetical protein